MKTEQHKTTPYFHRDYENDLGTPSFGPAPLEQGKRVVLVALPFLSLHPLLRMPTPIGLGGARVYQDITCLLETIHKGDLTACSYQLFQTMFSIASLAGTLIAHPAGMLLTTSQDLLIEIARFAQHLQAQEYEKAFESGAKIINHALYLTLWLDGGLKITLLSLISQLTLCLILARKEWNAGHWLETAGQLGMALVRARQIQTHLPQPSKVKTPFKENVITAIYDEDDYPIIRITRNEQGELVLIDYRDNTEYYPQKDENGTEILNPHGGHVWVDKNGNRLN